jgi:hypothetical protein
MKLFTLASICLLGAQLMAGPIESRTEGLAPLRPQSPIPPPAPWSIVGDWTASHPDWTDTMTFAADGTFSRAQNHWSGHWTLTTLQGHVILVLAWDNWAAETLTMMGPTEFSGRVGDGEMTIHRIEPPRGRAPAFETAAWHQGEAPIRLIRKEEGFCALTLVTGSFQGAGEMVRVYVGDDGYWYLGGESHQEGVAAQCIIVRYHTEDSAPRGNHAEGRRRW